MQITNVEAIHLRIEDPNVGLFDGSYDDCVIVVSTDAGITGIGEVESLAPAIQGIVNAPSAHSHARGLREVLLGQDPLDPPHLWQMMYDATDYIGRRGLAMHAIGGVDIALWDIAGQASGKPIYELLGGARRRRLLAYGTIYPTGTTPEDVRRQIRDVASTNLRAFKLCVEPWWPGDIPRTTRLLQAAREEVGEDGLLMIDGALAYKTLEEGLALLPVFRDVRICFWDAPLPLDNVEGHAKMAGEGVPLAVGDLGLTHVDEFIDVMERGRADICQPDITMVGGFTGLRKIAKAAAERNRRVVPHGYKTNITIAANAHFLANHIDDEVLEYSTSRSPIRWKTTLESLPVEEDGTVIVPDRPGLGVAFDWDFVNAHRWPGGRS